MSKGNAKKHSVGGKEINMHCAREKKENRPGVVETMVLEALCLMEDAKGLLYHRENGKGDTVSEKRWSVTFLREDGKNVLFQTEEGVLIKLV